jgi:hypothetical protein
MGAGQAAAGRPLGATVEVRLQRHGPRVEEQCQNDTVQILFFFFFFFFIIIIIYIFFICGDPKMGYNKSN